ncbi:murein hydrolase activator EnvC family protein [Ferrovum sp. JA12]|uniref:murein hydrolase activator EnvC family protein n=1 Tax=Ferrovum sp. JA12 TaxID=1356299 RepID=UPI000702C647|nr:peptidoglycan DD-metalloendopeptidase family protein [Ferrovum sp. JA12]
MKRLVCLMMGLLWLSVATATPKHDLNHVQKQIHQLKKDLNQTQHNRTVVQHQIRQLEAAINASAKKRYQLQLRETQLRQTVADLERETQQASLEQSVHQSNLGALINQRYEHALSVTKEEEVQTDPQFWLRLEYLSALAQDQDVAARLALFRATRLEKIAQQQKIKVDELKQVELTFKQQSLVLEKQKKTRDQLYAELSKTEQGQQQRLDNLIKNEKALTQLVRLLEKKAQQRSARLHRKKIQHNNQNSSPLPEGNIGKNTLLPTPTEANDVFQRLKGHLHLPLVGELGNRFGSPRLDTGLTWHGIFIRAKEGQPVKAVATGRVVYADWLRGFGNLIIIDHGSGYMSLYGDAQSIVVSLGQEVMMGDTIATSGRSGSNSQTGIYFELRYQSKPFDPLSWVGGR